MKRFDTNRIHWPALNKLYFALISLAPSVGSLVAHAVVTGRLFGPQAGLDALDAAETQIGSAFQPLWAARADLQARLGKNRQALVSYDKAISLATDTPTMRLLSRKRETVAQD